MPHLPKKGKTQFSLFEKHLNFRPNNIERLNEL